MNGLKPEKLKRTKIRLTWPELILSVVLIMLVEGLIFYLAAMHSGSVSAMNYVSFAGTLLSIVLAVIAIIYTMVESLKQSNTSEQILSGAFEVKNSAGDIADEVKSLKKLRIEIESISRNVDAIKSKIDDTNSGVPPSNSASIDVENPTTKLIDIEYLSIIVGSHFYLGPILNSLAILCVVSRIKPREFLDDQTFVNAMWKAHNETNLEYEAFKVAFFVYLRMLDGLDVIRIDSAGFYFFNPAVEQDKLLRIFDKYLPLDDGLRSDERTRNEIVNMVLQKIEKLFQ